jgi:hypothetical protein
MFKKVIQNNDDIRFTVEELKDRVEKAAFMKLPTGPQKERRLIEIFFKDPAAYYRNYKFYVDKNPKKGDRFWYAHREMALFA